MSAAAVAAISRCYSILDMDASPLRHKWAAMDGESWRNTLRRRREMLGRAGRGMESQYREWDRLSGSVRDALNSAEGLGA